jgi:hypothetical protein
VVCVASTATIQALSLPGIIGTFVFWAKRLSAQRILANALWRIKAFTTAEHSSFIGLLLFNFKLPPA